MTIYGFNDKTDALFAKQLARERRSHPVRGTSIGFPERGFNYLRAYAVVPEAVIPGAKRVGNRLFLGSGICKIYQREKNEEEDVARRIENPVKSSKLIPRLDDDGAQVKARVFNLCGEAIQPTAGPSCGPGSGDEIGEPLLFAVSDVWGDLFIVSDCSVPCSTSQSGSGSVSASASGGSSISASGSVSTSGCNYTGDVDVVTGGSFSKPTITLTVETLTFRNGKLCGKKAGTDVELDLGDCCPGSGSGSGSASGSILVAQGGPIHLANGAGSGFMGST